jgi:outer membrane receptor protein involved in Fe transport
MESLIASNLFCTAVVNVSGVWRDAISILPDQPGYVLLNAAVTYDVTESFHVQATVSNLADTVVQTPTITLPGIGAPNPGRNVRLGIVYDF